MSLLETSHDYYPISDVSKVMKLTEKTLKERCRQGIYNHRIIKKGSKNNYYISRNSLPEHIILKLDGLYIDSDSNYANAPIWAKKQADKYLTIIKATENFKGSKIIEILNEWNNENPEFATTYSSLMRMKKRYDIDGINGLLAKYGHHNAQAKIPDEFFEYFKELYLKEGCPSAQSCWDSTYGYIKRTYPNVDLKKLPKYSTFLRRLEREVPKQHIFFVRYGEAAWNRKFGNYIERDYSNITCNQVWVSDHAQIDVACLDENNKVVFPWVTAWRDYKSGKWLGWFLQTGSPNSDHIFQTFFYAVEKFGLPKDVIIDNGKDYRCKDFAGGRHTIRIEANKIKTTSMLDELNVNVHFALPYNAQTKPIERDFLKIKELISKHCEGYRGGNIVERPKVLAKEIKQGKIMLFADFKKVFDRFIPEVLNKKPSQGKTLNGLCPDQLFNEEFKEKIYIPHDALKLFCMRTSRNFTIGRNGIQDRQLGITYWSDWMMPKYGLKVYLRRDPENYKEAWAFNSENEEFVGFCTAVDAVAALYANQVSKEEFKTALANKKRNIKIAKSYIVQNRTIDIAEQCENYIAAYSQAIKDAEPRITKFANTKMEDAIKKKKEMDEYGMQDLSGFVAIAEQEKENKTIFLYNTDKKFVAEEQEKGVVANG